MRTAFTPAQSLALDQAVAALAMGGLVAMPTETVYGLAADATHPAAMGKIYALKRRPAGHPLIVHVAHVQALEAWARDIPAGVQHLAQRCWPGPLTLVLKKQPWVSDLVTGGQDTIAVRVPAHPMALELLRRFGLAHSGAIAAPSANRYGKVSPTRLDHVRGEFPNGIDVYVDGGACEVGIESTIVDLTRERPYLLRPGSVGIDVLSDVLGVTILQPDGGAPRVPGSTVSHYAPSTPAYLCSTEELNQRLADVAQRQDFGVLARSESPVDDVVWLRAPNEPEGYARVLYAGLRQLDSAKLSAIYIEAPPLLPAWDAVRDRLQRACVPSKPCLKS